MNEIRDRILAIDDWHEMAAQTREEAKVMNNCPLCDKDMESLYKRELLEKQKGFHYWCYPCNHGWYIVDLINVVRNNLAYAVSKGKHGKSPDEIRAVILTKDKEEK